MRVFSPAAPSSPTFTETRRVAGCYFTNKRSAGSPSREEPPLPPPPPPPPRERRQAPAVWIPGEPVPPLCRQPLMQRGAAAVDSSPRSFICHVRALLLAVESL